MQVNNDVELSKNLYYLNSNYFLCCATFFCKIVLSVAIWGAIVEIERNHLGLSTGKDFRHPELLSREFIPLTGLERYNSGISDTLA